MLFFLIASRAGFGVFWFATMDKATISVTNRHTTARIRPSIMPNELNDISSLVTGNFVAKLLKYTQIHVGNSSFTMKILHLREAKAGDKCSFCIASNQQTLTLGNRVDVFVTN